jgi:hypothetical protein
MKMHAERAQKLLAEPEEGLAPGPWLCERRWPPKATAALSLRRALAHAQRWVDAAVKVQRRFRNWSNLTKWRHAAAWYRSRATALQCWWRQALARRKAIYRFHQKNSSWEELLDAASQVLYYFDNRSQRSQWFPPAVPYKPLGWWPPHPDDVPVPDGFCFICKQDEAIRRCDQCVNKNGRNREFCLACYSRVHDFGGQEYARHTFTVPMRDAPNKLPELLCAQCKGPASRKCDVCTDFFCLACFRRMHAKGNRKDHPWKSYATTAVPCVECEADVATLACVECDELFCSACFSSLHAKGHRASHTTHALPVQVVKQGVGL